MVYLPSTPSVIGIYGSLGGGKTLTAVDICLNFIHDFNFVVSNILLKNLSDRENAYYRYIDDISVLDWFSLPNGSPRGSGGRKRVAVVLDELPELLDQYTSGKELWVKTFLSWLRHTSKNGQYVFIITQDPSFILKPVRLLCHYWIKCEDMAEFRLPVIKLKLPFVKDFVSRRTYNRESKCINGSLNIVRKSVVGRFYDTSQGLSITGRGRSRNGFNDPYSAYMAMCDFYRRYYCLSVFQFLLIILVLFLLL